MSGIGNAGTTVARKISVLKRGIDKSLMELTEVEVAINAEPNSSLVEGGGLKRKRLLLMNLIARMDAKLKQLQARSPIHQTCDAALDLINRIDERKDVQRSTTSHAE